LHFASRCLHFKSTITPPAHSAQRNPGIGEGVPELQLASHRASGLVDVLDRVLDKGLVIAGDVRISLAEVELLTIRIRLIVCSIDKAQSIGLDWWKHDSHLAPGLVSRGNGARALPGASTASRTTVARTLKRSVRVQERTQVLPAARPIPRNGSPRRSERPSTRLRFDKRRRPSDAS
jgi:gas vesicle protein GvpA/GvpJ/GvpM family